MKSEKSALGAQKIAFPEEDFKVLVREQESISFPRAFHEEIEIKCFTGGRSGLMIDNGMIVAESGDITIVNPYEIHASVNIDQAPATYFIVLVDLDFFAKTGPYGVDLRHIFFAQGVRFKNLIRGDGRLCAVIRRIAEEMRDRREYYRTAVYSLLCELFALLLRDYIDPEKTEAGAGEKTKRAETIAPALARIFSNFGESVSLDELAEACCVSRYHFCRVFKEETGMSVNKYILHYRLSMAEMLLKNTDLNVSEIAYQCGFGDASYFSRCYKKAKGVAPIVARREKTVRKKEKEIS